MAYDLYPAVDEDFNFPPEILEALRNSLQIQNGIESMTQVQRNALTAEDRWPGRTIFNTTTQSHQVWRSDFSEWHEGLDAPGSVKEWDGPSIPTGWMKRDGRELSRTEYSALFSRIGTTHGDGDGVTTFNIPSAAGRVTIDATGSHPLGQVGGAETHQITVAELPQHNHSGATGGQSADHSHVGGTDAQGTHQHLYDWITDGSTNTVNEGGNAVYRASRNAAATTAAGGHAHNVFTYGASNDHTHAIPNQGGNAAHNNMQPFIAAHIIIKY